MRNKNGYSQWKQAVDADLKGVPFEKKMITPTREGIALQPIYTEADLEDINITDSFPGFSPYVRGSQVSGYLHRSWDISQALDYASPAEFNEAAKTSVERGLTALNMVLDTATRNGHDPDWAEPGEVGVGGMSLATLHDLERALQGIDLEKISLFIRSGASAMPVAAMLAALARKRGMDLTKLRGCIEMDPLGVLSHAGILPHSLKNAYREMAILANWVKNYAPNLQTICVHTRTWHESGGNAIHQLAFGLATGVSYIREMERQGLSINVVAPQIRFAMTVGSEFFLEISKLRAVRLLWAQAIQSLGGNEKAQQVHIHVRTSLRNKTVYDPYVNVLRSTVEAFAGVLGGCDSMQVGAFDEVFRSPDDFSRRLARNTQLILAKECNLTAFIDSAGGSWYLDKRTNELAEKAWSLFQHVESLGGMYAAMEKGFVQNEIKAAAEEQKKSCAHRRLTLVGTNKFVNAAEQALPKTPFDGADFWRKRRQHILSYRTEAEDVENQIILMKLGQMLNLNDDGVFEACIDLVGRGATLGEVTRVVRINDIPVNMVKPVQLERLAEPFEKIRNVVTTNRDQGVDPVIYLIPMGPPAQHRARADFSKAFFEVAGFKVRVPDGFTTVAEAAKAVRHEAPFLVVICSTDETYPELVPTLLAEFKRDTPGLLVALAGNPGPHLAAFQAAGVDFFVHLKSDVLEILEAVLEKGGIANAEGV